MTVQNEGRISSFGRAVTGMSVVLGLALSIGSYDDNNFWAFMVGFVLICFATYGMWAAHHGTRGELKNCRIRAAEEESRMYRDQQLLDECKQRSELREKVRAGLAKDDGLTEFGRELANNPQLAETISELEAKSGLPLPARTIDIFAREKVDHKIEAAWRKKVLAEEAWEKIRKD